MKSVIATNAALQVNRRELVAEVCVGAAAEAFDISVDVAVLSDMRAAKGTKTIYPDINLFAQLLPCHQFR